MELDVRPPSGEPSGCRSLWSKGFATIFFGLFFFMGAIFTLFILGET